jgi:beta-xylosidase
MKRILISLTCSFLLAACGGIPTPDTEATPQETVAAIQPTQPTDTPMPTDTPTPNPTVTPEPTDTPVPIPPTATPVVEISGLFRDDFDGVLAAGWSWIREDPTHWNQTDVPGALRIVLQPGGIGLIASSPANNLLLRQAPDGDFEIATLVHFTPTSNFQFAGLLIYQNDANALTLGRAFCSASDVCAGNGIYFDKTQHGEFGENYATATANQSEAHLRLRREGTTYTGMYSEDGANWIVIGQHTADLTSLRVGLIAAQAYEAETTADFDYFTIEPLP